MVKKIIQQQPEEIEPEGTQEEEAQQQEEVQEVQPVTKPKRVLTEKQLESLARAREAAAHKKRELKELAQKAKALPKKEIEVKALHILRDEQVEIFLPSLGARAPHGHTARLSETTYTYTHKTKPCNSALRLSSQRIPAHGRRPMEWHICGPLAHRRHTRTRACLFPPHPRPLRKRESKSSSGAARARRMTASRAASPMQPNDPAQSPLSVPLLTAPPKT
jgi:hypothetical protein